MNSDPDEFSVPKNSNASIDTMTLWKSCLLSGHANTLTVGTDPGRAVTDPPQIFFKTVFADHKPAGTAQAVGLLGLAAMTLVFAKLSSPIPGAFGLFLTFFGHRPNSSFNHW
jgi:hypothetical protein